MNDRIRELAEQAGFQYTKDEGIGWAGNYNSSLPKFAELIVQEMLRLLEQYSRDSFPEDIIDDFDKGYLAGLHTAQEAVKKHFGVE
jgi:hypothetical protein